MTPEELQNQFQTLDRTSRHSFIEQALADGDGRRFLWWLLRIGNVLGGQPFADTPERTAFGCGEMQVGNLILLEIIEASTTGLPRLMLEMLEEDKARQEELAKLTVTKDSYDRSSDGLDHHF